MDFCCKITKTLFLARDSSRTAPERSASRRRPVRVSRKKQVLAAAVAMVSIKQRSSRVQAPYTLTGTSSGSRLPAETLYGHRGRIHGEMCDRNRFPDRAKRFGRLLRKTMNRLKPSSAFRSSKRSWVVARGVTERHKGDAFSTAGSCGSAMNLRGSRDGRSFRTPQFIHLNLEPEEMEAKPPSVADSMNLESEEYTSALVDFNPEHEEEDEQDMSSFMFKLNLEPKECDWPCSPCSSVGSCSP